MNKKVLLGGIIGVCALGVVAPITVSNSASYLHAESNIHTIQFDSTQLTTRSDGGSSFSVNYTESDTVDIANGNIAKLNQSGFSIICDDYAFSKVLSVTVTINNEFNVEREDAGFISCYLSENITTFVHQESDVENRKTISDAGTIATGSKFTFDFSTMEQTGTYYAVKFWASVFNDHGYFGVIFKDITITYSC